MIKKILLFSIFSLIIVFFSCQLPEILDEWNNFKFDKIKFNNIIEVQEWVVDNIDYVSDIKSKEKDDYWRYPDETLDDGKGDCEDMAILIIAIVHCQFNYKCNLVVVKIENNIYHALIRYKGDIYYSTTKGKYKKTVQIAEEYEYYEIPYKISAKR